MSEQTPHRTDGSEPAAGPVRRTWKQRLIWPGGLIAMIVAIVIVDVTMLSIATRDRTFAVAQVDGDPSAAWNRKREQQRRNDALGWDAALRVDLPAGKPPQAVLELHDAAGRPLENATISLVAFHNARAAERLKAVLVADADAPGTYRGSVRMRRDGWWTFELDATVGEDRFTLEEDQFLLLPSTLSAAEGAEGGSGA